MTHLRITRHVCPPVTPSASNNLSLTGRIFMIFYIWTFFESMSRRVRFHETLTRRMGNLHENLRTFMGTAVAQWLRCCATNQKFTVSIPAGVSGFFIDIKSFRSHYGPGADSASNRNEYQEYFLGVKAAGA